jgi:hypothetical protein
MKNKIAIMQLSLLSVLLLSIAGCTGDFENINRNPNEVTEDEIQRENYKVGANIRGLQSLVIPVQEHMYQFNESLSGTPFAGYMGDTPDGWRDKFSTFNPSADWLKWPFVNVIAETYPYYRSVIGGTDDPVANALAKIFRVAIMHRVTDTYGPIPYSKIVEDKKESLTVAYDTQKEVYTKMFAELDEALAALTDNVALSAEAFRKFDNVYYGDIAKWIRYTNSLKLRMAVRISYVEPALAKEKAEEAVAGGVIEGNADNAAMHAAENRMTLIYNDWADSRAGADILNYMNGYEDPRREKMFTRTAGSGFVGIRRGVDTQSKAQCVEAYSNMLVKSSDPYLWMNAAEVTFLRAEGALRGWSMGGTPKDLYEKAITLSFQERGADGAAAYIADASKIPAHYIDPLGKHSVSNPQSSITIAWETEDEDTDAVMERNLERIITQKYIAIFPLGVEAWSEYRRTGYPRLLPVVENKSGGTVDSERGYRRLPYPVEEYTANNSNLQKAITDLGGPDNGSTRVWWDVKPMDN